MKKTILVIALAACSLTAREFLSEECSYLDNMSQQQLLAVPQDKSKIETHMDCLFEFIAKEQNKQLKGKRIDKNTIFESMTYNKNTNALKSSNIMNDISVATLKQNTPKAKDYTCNNQIFTSFMPYGLKMITVFKDQKGNKIHSIQVSNTDCK